MRPVYVEVVAMVVDLVGLKHAYVESGTQLDDQDGAHVWREEVVLEDKEKEEIDKEKGVQPEDAEEVIWLEELSDCHLSALRFDYLVLWFSCSPDSFLQSQQRIEVDDSETSKLDEVKQIVEELCQWEIGEERPDDI